MMTSALAPRAICGVPSVEPPSATMMWSTRWRGNAAMTARNALRFVERRNHDDQLSLTGDLASKAGDAGNDRLLTGKLKGRWHWQFLCRPRGHRLHRRPQFAHGFGGASDSNAPRNS